MREYLIAVLLEKRTVGNEFGRWPLHITLVPWFELDNLEHAQRVLEDICQSHSAFEVEVGEEALFGAKHDIPVNVVSSSNALQRVHEVLINGLKEAGVEFKDTQIILENFHPHITQQAKASAQPGFKLKIKDLYLISAPNNVHPTSRIKCVEAVASLYETAA